MLVQPTVHSRPLPVRSGGIAGRRILLAEDDYFIVSDIARAFRAMGAHLIGPFATVEGVMEYLDAAPGLDGAVLDINLRGRMAFAIADRLMREDVPFIFSTGYDDSVIPPRFNGVVRCEKPVRPAAIAKALFG